MTLSKGLWKTFAVLFGAFTILNFAIGTANSGPAAGFLTASATLSGPMTGAVARNFQNCCLNFSIHLLPYFLPFLALAVLSQLGSSPPGSKTHLFRTAAWIIGWTGWFAGALLSFAHALS